MANVLIHLLPEFSVSSVSPFPSTKHKAQPSTLTNVTTKCICDVVADLDLLPQLIAMLPFPFYSTSLRFLLFRRILFAGRLSSFSTINNLPP